MKRLFILTTTAVVTLIPAAVLSMTGATRETVGVHDDWTASVLQEGKLRLCYAETKLVAPAKARQGLGDVRLQVTSRSLSDGSDMARLTKDPDSSDMEIALTIGSGQLVPLNRLEKFVKHMKAGEAAKIEMILRRKTDGTTLGTYSLRGFTKAYDEASKICSPRRYWDHYKEPVRVSNISAVVEPSLYSEFSFSGPFFTAKSFGGSFNALFRLSFEWAKARVTVRAVPRDSDDTDLAGYLGPVPNPEGIFRYGSNRLEFYIDHELYDVYPTAGVRTNEVTGACFDPETKRLRLLMSSWDGGATIAGDDIVVYSDPHAGVVGEPVSLGRGIASMVDCSDNESAWQWGGSFYPCVCAGRAANDQYRSRLKEVIREIGRLSSRKSGASLFNLLFDIAGLEPWLQWDDGTDLDVQRFESSKFEVVVITHEDHLNAFNCDQTVFVRRLVDEYFVPVYEAAASSKGFKKVEIHGFSDADVLDITLCVERCYSWGRYERMTKNLTDWWREGRR